MREDKMLQVRIKERLEAQKHNHLHVPVPCNCGDRYVRTGMWNQTLMYTGVSFTEEQARLVAKTLNNA